MSDEARKVLAFFLCGLIMIWWMASSAKKAPRRRPQQKSIAQTIKDQPSTSQKALQRDKGEPSRKRPVEQEQAVVEAIEKSSHQLDNAKLTLQLTNFGGYLETAWLKGFGRQLDSEDELVRLRFARDPSRGAVVWNFAVNEAPFTDRALARVVEADKRQIVFEYPRRGPLKLKKYYTLDDESYVLGMRVELSNESDELLLIDTSASMAAEMDSENVGRFNGSDPLTLIGYVNDKQVKTELRKVESKSYPGNAIPWTGVMDRYFLAALLPGEDRPQAVRFSPVSGDVLELLDASGRVLQQSRLAGYTKAGNLKLVDKALGSNASLAESFRVINKTGEEVFDLPVASQAIYGKEVRLTKAQQKSLESSLATVALGRTALEYPTRRLAPGEKTTFHLDLFLGPKELSVLDTVGKDLEQSLDLGEWIGPIAKPMLQFMKWSYGWIGNYGWVIILLTVLVRLLLYPLTHIQFRSMKKMQALKPHIDELREKHKGNKEELNRQMMGLFRTHRVNPMGGCFPLLIQMPVFFALYRVLYTAIELRHAPFIFWISDLSAKDPFYVTPILLGGAMFVQQKMTPMAGMDPAQANMMKLMPIMFAGFMLFLPSGLVVYIFVSTLLGLLQQWFVNRPQQENTKQAA